MPDILRPDLKAIVWAAIGFMVLPMVMNFVKSKTGKG